MTRKLLLALILACVAPAGADTFTATYSELARSPAGYAASWYSGAVTKDNKFIYGMGHSHASYNNNGLWVYDPATNTHTSVSPDTGSFYRYDKDSAGKYIPKSGRWAALDPVKNKTLHDYFGGPDIYAPTNRNNHQAFYMPGVNQFWIMAGTSWDNGSWAWGGRFDLTTGRWAHVSKPWSDPTKSDLKDFGAGIIAGTPAGWAAANAATAVCPDLDTVVLFGGMTDSGGTVRIIEPNPAGPEPYRWANATTKAPIYLPAENVRHNAACVGDTVYFVSGQERVSNQSALRTPDPAPFWKFHVPSRTWTKLTPGPAGSYFTVMTYDMAAGALLVYGGSKSSRLWVYDLTDNTWHNLTGTVPNLPYADMHTGGYLAGFGHVYKGGKRYDKWGADYGYTESSKMMKIALVRVPPAVEPPPVVVEPPPAPVVSAFTWTKIPLPGTPLSPQGSSKHIRMVEGPGGRVWLLGGDWGGAWGENSGRQEVYSFDPLSPTGDWRLEAPYCGTTANPVHWHTDEAGVAWDAKRGVFWKLAGTEYGPNDACLAAGKSVKAKVIQFNPATKLWTVPAGFSQMRFGYVTNGLLDVAGDQMVQITDTKAFHLDLSTGVWASYPLPAAQMRFNVYTAQFGRDLWWLSRGERLEVYNLDTHKFATGPLWPFPQLEGYGTQMVFNWGGKLLVVSPTSAPTETRRMALYDFATKAWTVLAQGDGWGNTGMLHSSGKLILMGGGISGADAHNKQVWVGSVSG